MQIDTNLYKEALDNVLQSQPSFLLRFVNTREASQITGIPTKSLTTMRSRTGDGPPFVSAGERRIRYLVLHLFVWEVSTGFHISTESTNPVFDVDDILNRNANENGES